MTILRKLANNAAKIDIAKIVLEEVQRDEAFLIRANQTQLQDNKDSNGKSLGKYKSKSYAAFKGRLTIDLLLSGDFYKGFFVKARKFPIIFGSSDKKTKILTNKYGEAIFGLTKQNLGLFNKDILLPRVQDRIRKILHI